MAISVVATGNAVTTASRSPAITFGSYTPLSSDVIAFFAASTTAAAAAAAPTGWLLPTPASGANPVASDSHTYAFTNHIVTTAEAAAVTTTFTATNLWSVAQTGNVVGIVLRGVESALGLDSLVSTFDSTNTVTPHVLPALTGSNLSTNSLVVRGVCSDGTNTYTTPASHTARGSNNTNQGNNLYTMDTLTTSGSNVAATNVTPAGGDEYCAMSVAFNTTTAVSTLTDDGSTFDTNKWNKSGGVGTGTDGATLVIPVTTAYQRISSRSTYDLTGSALIVEVPTPLNASGSGVYTQVALRPETGAASVGELNFTFGDNVLDAVRTINSSTTHQATTYNATNHRWVKISELSGTIYFHASPDGTTWTQLWTTTPGTLGITALYVDLVPGCNSGTPGNALYDNINLPPSGTFTGGGTTTATATVTGAGAVGKVGAGAAVAAVAAITGAGTVGKVGSGSLTATAAITGAGVLNAVFVVDYATPALAAAAATGKRLIFPANQTYTTTGLSILAGCYVEGNNSTLKFGDNTTLITSNDALIDITGSNVTIDNLNLDGNGANQSGVWCEHRHCVKILGAYDNIIVKNTDGLNIISDGVYINTQTHGNIVIGPNNTFATSAVHARNAVSIVSGDTIEVYSNTINFVSRNDMPGPIDIECNDPTDHLAHVDVHDNTIVGGSTVETGTLPGIVYMANVFNAASVDVKIRNNDISGTRFTSGLLAIGINGGPFNNATGLVFDGNNVHGIGTTGKIGAELDYWIGADVTNNTFNGMQYGIYEYHACLGASTGNTFTGVTTNIVHDVTTCGGVSGAGTLTATATITGAGTVGKVGSGSLTATAALTGAGTVGKVGAGTLTVAATVTGSGSVAVTGAGSLTATATVTGAGSVAVTGSGSVAVTAVISGSATGTITGNGSLPVVAAITGAATVARTGTGSVAVAAVLTGAASVAVTGAGSQAGVATVTGAGAVGKVGAGSVAASAALTGAGTVTAGGSSSLTVLAVITGAGTVTVPSVGGSLSAVSVITGGGVVGKFGAGSLTVAAVITGAYITTVTPYPDRIYTVAKESRDVLLLPRAPTVVVASGSRTVTPSTSSTVTSVTPSTSSNTVTTE